MEIAGLTRRVVVRDPADAGEARRQAQSAAERAGLDETRKARLAIIVAEMASNLAKHATAGGEMLINVLDGANGSAGVEVLALDRGPGISNPQAVMEDRVSSAGTLGIGLGSIRRQADEFAFHSLRTRGTTILARIYTDGPRPDRRTFDIGMVHVARDGEEVSGDAWSVRPVGDGIDVMVVDGLGHGLLAADAAGTAVSAFRRNGHPSPAETLRAMHDSMRATRGATAAIAAIDTNAGLLTYGGVGNIAGAICDHDRTRRLVSLNGTLGREPVSYKQFQSAWTEGATLVMHSDGLTSKWRFDDLPGLLDKDPTLIAAVLFRDYARDLDDAIVLVLRQNSYAKLRAPA
ncbi:MAG TPA: ATP-binding SpoIIE family protein phosphatase [Candidatus Dormibacteraeota bacterium]|nr:ATP-binding SpoIIE family protein phosphatase [Candidatus Dormibacteraeota bacterium]